jgi:hypothetical protein
MSEYSFSYHLYKTSAKEAITILKQARLDGIVLDVFGAWTPMFLPEMLIETDYSRVEADPRLLARNQGILLRYVCQEDHNCAVLIYEGKQIVFQHISDWNRSSLQMENLSANSTVIERYIAPRANLTPEELLRQLQPATLSQAINHPPAKALAKAFGLIAYEWTSFHHLSESGDVPRDNRINAMYWVHRGKSRRMSDDSLGPDVSFYL